MFSPQNYTKRRGHLIELGMEAYDELRKKLLTFLEDARLERQK